jgi:hypothetical protein
MNNTDYNIYFTRTPGESTDLHNGIITENRLGEVMLCGVALQCLIIY